MKKNFKIALLALLLTCLKFSPVQASWTFCPSSTVDASVGETFYTRFSFFCEKDQHLTTNYRKGMLISINTPVIFLKANKKEIVVSLCGRKISILNVPKYSGESIQGIFDRTFSRCPVNLDGYSYQDQENILTGNVEIGMDKEAVILALGYPPKHQTPTLLSPQWRYWKSKFGTFIVYFSNDKVSGFKGLGSPTNVIHTPCEDL
jgi:hypothetical protein